ncbi:MAG TPA: DMSO/selenate family reductase complex B subunit [Symbiobacteriaceae bacterium]|nr:DMSO/selenate family reductase complex B subunit [Symbiobacteriaceae bacterium]
MAQMGFYYDMTACIACKTCQVACNDKNDLKVGTLFRRVHTFEGGKFPKPWVYHLSIACNHCAEPRCVQNCPTGALSKREKDGLVVHDKDACIGCRYCTWACPYGAPQFIEEAGRIGKCTGCADLVDRGQNPACVDACGMRVLEFGEVEALRQKYGDSPNLVVLPDPGITTPSLVIKPNLQALK